MLARVGWGFAALIVLLYAIEGGEYGTSDLIHLHARHRALVARIDSLQHRIDSLSTLAHAIETDPAVQERIAREEFGMVRGSKELLYRFAPPSVHEMPHDHELR
jgi:cell division protein FtsB